jgi:hypothetical protein
MRVIFVYNPKAFLRLVFVCFDTVAFTLFFCWQGIKNPMHFLIKYELKMVMVLIAIQERYIWLIFDPL